MYVFGWQQIEMCVREKHAMQDSNYIIGPDREINNGNEDM